MTEIAAPFLSRHTPFQLAGRRILITGASGGIGQATSRACARLGASLLLTDLHPDPALLDSLRTQGTTVDFQACDVSDRAAVEALCAQAGPVDAAILNAGLYLRGDWNEPGFDDDFARSNDVNMRGALNFSRALLPVMKARGAGRLVLVGSVGAFTGGTLGTVPISYLMAKGGIHALVRWLMHRGAPEVQVNAVAPGPVRTPMITEQAQGWSPAPSMPIPRLAEPDEVAWPMAFLCSDAASFINGSILDINGGNYTR